MAFLNLRQAMASQFNRIWFLFASGSPLYVIMLYASYGIRQLIDNKTTYDGTFFSGNIHHWSRLFQKYNVNAKNILEIGSFKGDSARFLIDYFGDAQLTCVDTWAGSEELG